MSDNLLDLATSAIGSPVLKQLSRILDTDEEKTQSGINVVLPASLGMLIKKSSTSEGAADVFRQVEQQDDNILDHLSDLLGGAGRAGLLSGGLTSAKTLFGKKFDALGGRLGDSTGLGARSISKLLSFLVPVMLSLLSRKTRLMGLDATGMASLLADQKDSLSDLLPAELSDELGLGEVLSGAGSAAQAGGRAVADAAQTAANTATEAAAATSQSAGALGGATLDAAKVGSSAMVRLFPIIGLLALALLGWMFLKGGTRNAQPVSPNGDEGVVIEGSDDISLNAPVVNDPPGGSTGTVESFSDESTETSQSVPPQ
jgi:hypothetical protein